jgi:hypothetical protein
MGPQAGLVNSTMHQRRLIYNSDADNMFHHAEPPMRAEDLTPYIDEIAGTGVSTLSLSPNLGMKVNYPSRVAEMLTPDSAQDTGQSRLARNLASLVAAGHDPLGLAFDLARERGLEVFASFRLNEVHGVEDPASPVVSGFWRKHPEWHLGQVGDPLPELHREIIGPRVNPIVSTWIPGALNYAVPEVRALRLAEIREVCERYPIDGLELDFQRFPAYFPFGREAEHAPMMDAFVGRVRKTLDELGRKAGRRILLSARIMARPEQNAGIGLDPFKWSREGMLDFVIISHYLRNDYPLPVAEYRKLLPESLPIYASIEYERDPDEYRRIAKQLWRDGVDGIMLFNFFAAREGNRQPPLELLDELGDPGRLGIETRES